LSAQSVKGAVEYCYRPAISVSGVGDPPMNGSTLRIRRPTDEWVYLEDTGTVNTFSICYTDWLARRIKEPELPAMIEIDGSGGVAIMGKLGEVDPKEIRIGMRVKAVWKPEGERIGAITDIKYWEPLKEG